MSIYKILQTMEADAKIDACFSAVCQKVVACALGGTAWVQMWPVPECFFNLPSTVIAPAELKLSEKKLVPMQNPAKFVVLAWIIGKNIHRTLSIDTDETLEVVLRDVAAEMLPSGHLELRGATVSKSEAAAVVTLLANRWNAVRHEVLQTIDAQIDVSL